MTTTIKAKVDHVMRERQRGQNRDHTCHWPGCTVQVVPALWGCLPHWRTLPKHLQQAIWRAYEPGQEVNGTPSASYVAVARAVQAWIKEYEAKRAARPQPHQQQPLL